MISALGDRRPRKRFLVGMAATVLLATACPAAMAAAEESANALGTDVVAAYLARSQEYLERGEYARALYECEQVLQVEYLSVDSREQAEACAEVAERYRRGERLTVRGFVEGGGGYYRENTTDSTRLFGDDPARDAFLALRGNSGVSYLAENGLTFDGGLDYRFRDYDDTDRRDDRDLRWNGSVTRPLQDGSQAIGVRGRVSYRGDPGYRNDYGLFGNREWTLDSDDRLTVEAEVRRRRYPSELRDRSYTNAGLSATWNRAGVEGLGNLGVTVTGGREWADNDRTDGDQTFYGASADWDRELGPTASLFLFAWYEHNGYHSDRVVYDEDDAAVAENSRADDLYELGGGIIHRFAEGWTLRPEIVYVRDESNKASATYSSTEIWVTVRRAF
jgi:hypothetical protein